jgi:hypothetical protein
MGRRRIHDTRSRNNGVAGPRKCRLDCAAVKSLAAAGERPEVSKFLHVQRALALRKSLHNAHFLCPHWQRVIVLRAGELVVRLRRATLAHAESRSSRSERAAQDGRAPRPPRKAPYWRVRPPEVVQSCARLQNLKMGGRQRIASSSASSSRSESSGRNDEMVTIF